jgi:hypothetical protein
MPFDKSILAVRNYARATELNILIWGPGSTGGEHYEKRLKIRDVVQSTFPHADVAFSEDEALKRAIPHADLLSIPQQEAWHLAASDACVVLDTSKGAGEEIAHFSGSKDAYKLIIFTDKKYEGANSFPAELRKYGVLVFYSEEEYSSCSLTEKVIARLDQTALGKMTGLMA